MSDPEDFATLFAREVRPPGSRGRSGREGTRHPDHGRERLRRRGRQGRGLDRARRADRRRGHACASRSATRSRPRWSRPATRCASRTSSARARRPGRRWPWRRRPASPSRARSPAVIKGGYEVTVGGLRGLLPVLADGHAPRRRPRGIRRPRPRVPGHDVRRQRPEPRALPPAAPRGTGGRGGRGDAEEDPAGRGADRHGGLARRLRRVRGPGRRAGPRAPVRDLPLARRAARPIGCAWANR